MNSLLRSLILFIIAGLCEIGGGWLIWKWLRDGRPGWWGLIGGVVLTNGRDNYDSPNEPFYHSQQPHQCFSPVARGPPLLFRKIRVRDRVNVAVDPGPTQIAGTTAPHSAH